MNTPTTRSTVNLLAHRTSEVHAQPTDAAGKSEKNAKDANAGAETSSSLVKREAAIARVPKGPFKILTIPQSWYDSLHAAPTAVADAGKEHG